MASFTDTFKRKEVKYRLSDGQYRRILHAMQPYMALDTFGQTRITSLYFDTPTRDLIARSLEKPLYKEKLRVRWYGVPAEGDRAYVEIKKKFKGIVYKRRVGCTRNAAAALLMRGAPYDVACKQFPLSDALQQEESLNSHSLQIAAEIQQFCNFHAPLNPSMYIQCERKAYALKTALGECDEQQPLESNGAEPGGSTAGVVPAANEDALNTSSDLRITFDSGVAYRDAFAEAAGARVYYRPLLNPGEVIMEVKTSGAFPFWLVDALNDCEAYPSSFSKYGAAYQAVMHTCPQTIAQKEICYA